MTASLIVVIGAITSASRLEKKLSQHCGIRSRIIHTPDIIGNGGCSYSLRTRGEHLPLVMQIANDCKIKVKAYYLAEVCNGKEVYHVIS